MAEPAEATWQGGVQERFCPHVQLWVKGQFLWQVVAARTGHLERRLVRARCLQLESCQHLGCQRPGGFDPFGHDADSNVG